MSERGKNIGVHSPSSLSRIIGNWTAFLCMALLVELSTAAWAASRQEQPDGVRPGLVARFRAAADGAAPVEVLRVEPSVALRLQADESPHPRLPASGWSARWTGEIQILRGGTYRFVADLSGQLQVTVGEQEVLNGAGKEPSGDPIVGPDVKLTAGTQRFVAEFVKTQPRARVRLFWESEQFPREPISWRVLSHSVSDEPVALGASERQDRGRFLAEELSCSACHEPTADDALAAGLQKRQGPDLSQVGRRIFAGWIFSWLEDPQRVRPQAVMPRLFADDEAGRVQRYAVAAYLASLGGPLPAQERRPKDLREIVGRGEQSFDRVGCAVCHAGAEEHAAIAAVTDMGSKTTPERLAEYLADPLSVDPSGRMPDMSLSRGEAHDLAYWLCESAAEGIDRALPERPSVESVVAAFEQLESAGEERKAFAALEPEKQVLGLGRRLVTAKGCTNCHRIAPGGEALPRADAAPAFAVLRDPERQERGCLRGRATPGGESAQTAAPRFALTAGDRDALRAFLVEASQGPGTPAPTFAAAVTLDRFHCLACHERNGSGGLAPEQVDALRKAETAQETEQLTPPPLTEVGGKLQTAWLRAVLAERRRARPWMALRMPQFGRENVGHLPEALAACDGVDPGNETRQFAYDPDAIKVGRLLVGKTAFGCIGCHDIAGRPSSGTRGPDLASIGQRVRYDWYLRWLDDAQRMQPGTRMPTVFAGGRSSLSTLLGGSGAAQAGAIWQYLALGENLPLPEGVESHEALALAPKDRVLVVRTFMPEAGNRALAVGFPDGVSYAFDAAQCRLAYGWTGGFLDAAPIWNARGGRPADLLGPRFWTSPPQFPWALTTTAVGDVPPDWSKRAEDPALGAPLPEGTLPEEPLRIHFHGYGLEHTGAPTFHYALTTPGGQSFEVQERIEPRQELAGVGLLRHFTIDLGKDQTGWLLVAQSDQPIRLLRGTGGAAESLSQDGECTAADTHLLLDGGEQRPRVVSLPNGPAADAWVVRREAGRWYAMLRVAAPRAAAGKQSSATASALTVALWSPYRDDPAMIRALLEAESRTVGVP